MNRTRNRRSKQRGTALLVSLSFMTLVSVAMVTYLDFMLTAERTSVNRTNVALLQQADDGTCESVAGAITTLFNYYQSFATLDSTYQGATVATPVQAGAVNYANGVNTTAYIVGWNKATAHSRIVTIRTYGVYTKSGGIRTNSSGASMYVDRVIELDLVQSHAFDYLEFNNDVLRHHDGMGGGAVYWGDVRANGNLDLTGSHYFNGSVAAAYNPALLTENQGTINNIPMRYSDTQYRTSASGDGKIRPIYDPSIFGAVGTDTYKQIGSLSVDLNPSVQNGQAIGTVAMDATGIRAYDQTGQNPALLSSQGTTPITMPKMPSLSALQATSASWVDTTATFPDGTANPNYNKGAFVKVWNSVTNSYQQISTNGYVPTTAVLVGTSDHPILTHGPVTFANDIILKGNVSGQGTFNAGRSIFVVGSLLYTNPPDFRQNTSSSMLNNSIKADILGLVATGSVFMGKTTEQVVSTMTPPATTAKKDALGNTIPAYDGTQIDAYGIPNSKSLLGDVALNALVSPINEVDAIIYSSNFSGGSTCPQNSVIKRFGAVICQDAWNTVSGDFGACYGWNFSYDPRVKDRGNGLGPLIDLNLPCSPVVQSLTWSRGPYTS